MDKADTTTLEQGELREETVPEGPTVRPFAEWLHEQRRGSMHGDLSDALHELILGVLETGRAGKLALTVSVKLAGKGGRTVLVGDEIKLSMPQPDKEEALFFVDRDGNLSRDNPEQLPMPFHEVPRRTYGGTP